MSEKVRNMFASIAREYDRVNSVLSFGVHHLWRWHTVRLSGAKPGDSVLDCATGTGDLALSFKKKVGGQGYVKGTDFCKEMIDIAPLKARKKQLDIDFEVADTLDLPYEDNSFDISTIAFGIRNVDDPQKGISEMARVVKPGGRVVVLEFGQPKGLLKYPFTLYSKYIMPAVGGLISGNKDAYVYLPQTSARFPARENFLAIMNATGQFKESTFYPLTGGIAYIYVGTVH